jgi:hypothetical protein
VFAFERTATREFGRFARQLFSDGVSEISALVAFCLFEGGIVEDDGGEMGTQFC